LCAGCCLFALPWVLRNTFKCYVFFSFFLHGFTHSNSGCTRP
jgi:hypothetical protein